MRWGASPLAGSSASRADCVASKQLPAFVTYVWILLDLVFGFFFPTLFLSPPSFSILFSFGCLSCIAVHRPLLSTHSHARSPCPHGTSHFGDWDLRPLQNMLDLIPVRRSFRTRCLAAGHQISASKHESAPSVAQNGSFRLPESSRPQGKANMGQEWQCAWASQLAGSLVLCRTSANLVSPSVKVSQ